MQDERRLDQLVKVLDGVRQLQTSRVFYAAENKELHKSEPFFFEAPSSIKKDAHVFVLPCSAVTDHLF